MEYSNCKCEDISTTLYQVCYISIFSYSLLLFVIFIIIMFDLIDIYVKFTKYIIN